MTKKCKKCGSLNMTFTGKYVTDPRDSLWHPEEGDVLSPVWECLGCGQIADYYDQEAWCFLDEVIQQSRSL